eukprot:Hpha_TRINITY_DN19011_c0_g1::TRINITY_DN19011_c0_g1_i1::g.138451::m.138451
MLSLLTVVALGGTASLVDTLQGTGTPFRPAFLGSEGEAEYVGWLEGVKRVRQRFPHLPVDPRVFATASFPPASEYHMSFSTRPFTVTPSTGTPTSYSNSTFIPPLRDHPLWYRVGLLLAEQGLRRVGFIVSPTYPVLSADVRVRANAVRMGLGEGGSVLVLQGGGDAIDFALNQGSSALVLLGGRRKELEEAGAKGVKVVSYGFDAEDVLPFGALVASVHPDWAGAVAAAATQLLQDVPFGGAIASELRVGSGGFSPSSPSSPVYRLSGDPQAESVFCGPIRDSSGAFLRVLGGSCMTSAEVESMDWNAEGVTYVPDHADCTAGEGIVFTAGTYKCAPCAEGFFSTMGAFSCSQCAVGQTSRKGASVCDPCPAGYEGTTGGECRVCPDTHVSPGGLSPCVACPRNTVAAAGHAVCRKLEEEGESMGTEEVLLIAVCIVAGTLLLILFGQWFRRWRKERSETTWGQGEKQLSSFASVGLFPTTASDGNPLGASGPDRQTLGLNGYGAAASANSSHASSVDPLRRSTAQVVSPTVGLITPTRNSIMRPSFRSPVLPTPPTEETQDNGRGVVFSSPADPLTGEQLCTVMYAQLMPHPANIVQLAGEVRRFYADVTQAVEKAGGTVLAVTTIDGSFSILAGWNSHKRCATHSSSACFAVLEILNVLGCDPWANAASFRRRDAVMSPWAIGVATGSLGAFQVAPESQSAALFGEPLNVAKGLVSLALQLRVKALTDERVHSRVRTEICSRPIDAISSQTGTTKTVYEIGNFPPEVNGCFTGILSKMLQGQYVEARDLCIEMLRERGDSQAGRLLRISVHRAADEVIIPYARREQPQWEDIESDTALTPLPAHLQSLSGFAENFSGQSQDHFNRVLAAGGDAFDDASTDTDSPDEPPCQMDDAQLLRERLGDLLTDRSRSLQENATPRDRKRGLPTIFQDARGRTFHRSSTRLGRGSYGQVWLGMSDGGQMV